MHNYFVRFLPKLGREFAHGPFFLLASLKNSTIENLYFFFNINKTLLFLLCIAPYFMFYGKEGLLVIAIVTPMILMGSRAARAIICQPPIV